METIFLAGGCFWGLQHFLNMIPGVISSQVGYANSIIPDPSYKMVCSGATHAAETVKVTFNPQKVALADLLSLYFLTIDPTSVNRQGNDCGTQYRTGIYYTSPRQLDTINRALLALSRKYSRPLAIEVGEIENFYPAEDYHQDYLVKNPNGYCHIDPSIYRFVKSLK